jgi:hypothetical protein
MFDICVEGGLLYIHDGRKNIQPWQISFPCQEYPALSGLSFPCLRRILRPRYLPPRIHILVAVGCTFSAGIYIVPALRAVTVSHLKGLSFGTENN